MKSTTKSSTVSMNVEISSELFELLTQHIEQTPGLSVEKETQVAIASHLRDSRSRPIRDEAGEIWQDLRQS